MPIDPNSFFKDLDRIFSAVHALFPAHMGLVKRTRKLQETLSEHRQVTEYWMSLRSTRVMEAEMKTPDLLGLPAVAPTKPKSTAPSPKVPAAATKKRAAASIKSNSAQGPTKSTPPVVMPRRAVVPKLPPLRKHEYPLYMFAPEDNNGTVWSERQRRMIGRYFSSILSEVEQSDMTVFIYDQQMVSAPATSTDGTVSNELELDLCRLTEDQVTRIVNALQDVHCGRKPTGKVVT